MRSARWILCVGVAGATLFAVGVLFHVTIPVIAPHISTRFEDSCLFRPWTG